MGDIKLTPRQAATILGKLDDGVRNVNEARNELLKAMADRRTERPAERVKATPNTPRLKRR